MKLTDTICKTSKPKNKPFKRFDGGGLYLLVNPNGAKLWRLKYRFAGIERLLALGKYPDVSLADARGRRDDAKKLLAAEPPIDPMTRREEQKDQAIKEAQDTFEAVVAPSLSPASANICRYPLHSQAARIHAEKISREPSPFPRVRFKEKQKQPLGIALAGKPLCPE